MCGAADAAVAEGGVTTRVIETEPRGGLVARSSVASIVLVCRVQPASDRQTPRRSSTGHHPAGSAETGEVLEMLRDGRAGWRPVSSGDPPPPSPPEGEVMRESKATARRGRSPQAVQRSRLDGDAHGLPHLEMMLFND